MTPINSSEEFFTLFSLCFIDQDRIEFIQKSFFLTTNFESDFMKALRFLSLKERSFFIFFFQVIHWLTSIKLDIGPGERSQEAFNNFNDQNRIFCDFSATHASLGTETLSDSDRRLSCPKFLGSVLIDPLMVCDGRDRKKCYAYPPVLMRL